MNETDLASAAYDAERALLGAMILDRDVTPAIAGTITTEAFSLGRHRAIFDALMRLWERRVPADIVTVTAEVRTGGIGTDQLPDHDISSLILDVPMALHAPFYADQVVTFARRRAIAAASAKLAKAAYGDEDGTDLGELLATVRNAVEPFEPKHQRDLAHAADRSLEVAERSLAVWDGTFTDPVLRTHVREVDKLLNGGMRPGQLVIVGGRPGMGKTSLMVHLARHHRAHIVSLEMGTDEIMTRVIAGVAGVPYSVATEPIGDLRQRERFIDAAKTVATFPFTINDRARQTTAEIEGEMARLIADAGAQLLMIDHLDFLGDKIRGDSQEQRTAELVHRCKAMAQSLKVPVLLLAQLNRNVEHRPGYVPYLADFRNSGAIEQDADVAILLYRRRYYSERGMLEADDSRDYLEKHGALQRVELSVAKNRNGGIGTARIGWRPETMTFEEAAA